MTTPSQSNGCQLKYASVQEIDQVHSRLWKTFKAGTTRPLSYRRQQLLQLARMCQENAEAFADALKRDLGKPRPEAMALEVGVIVARSLQCAEKLEEWSRQENVEVPDWQKAWSPKIFKCPKGPVLIIAPWNYPMILSLQAFYAAIAAGCPAVVKPSEFVPTYSALLAELFPKYLDQNAYVVVNGGVTETTALLERRWAHIFYTGNGRVGRIVATAAAKHLTPVSLELGGKSPVIIDALNVSDLRIAAARVLYGKAANAGQTCVAPDHVLIPRAHQQDFIDACLDVLAERYPNGSLTAEDHFGRIVNAMHFKRVKGVLERTRGRIVYGGEAYEAKLRIALTIVADVSGDDALMEDELFGPILPIVPVENLDEAIDIVNAHDNPLAFYAFTDSAESKQRLLDETLSGSLVFNDALVQLGVNELPFSGVGESGYGYQIMKYGFDGFTHMRPSIDVPKEVEPHFAARYPPYTEEKISIMSANVHLPIPEN